MRQVFIDYAKKRLAAKGPGGDEHIDLDIAVISRNIGRFSSLSPAPADGALSVLLGRGTLGTGKYKLRLFGLQGTTKKQLGETGLSITVEQ